MESMVGQREQTPEEHTQDRSRRMQSDTALVQQTSHTRVCSETEAVRLKSMTLHCCCN